MNNLEVSNIPPHQTESRLEPTGTRNITVDISQISAASKDRKHMSICCKGKKKKKSKNKVANSGIEGNENSGIAFVSPGRIH